MDRESGQATVELVALLALVAALAGVLWQAAVAGQAVWLAGSAARAAARASAVGADARAAARRVLPAHLERAIDMGNGRFYFNCGTWIRLLKFTDAMLKDETTFEPIYNRLMDGTMSAIDAAEFEGAHFVLDCTSSVCIRIDGNGVVGELAHVTGDGTTREVVMSFPKA